MLPAAAIFMSALLLFLVQPLVARLILPWFGGSATVWTTCMLFFQSVLLAGYSYAHATHVRLGPRTQASLHTALLVVALLLLPVAPDESWKPTGSDEPISTILLMLSVAVGLPYLLLSATSPLVQSWVARSASGREPFRLFAVSNLASVTALIGYPLLIEPWLGLDDQVQAWSWLFALSAALTALLAWRTSADVPHATKRDVNGPKTPGKTIVSWIVLSGVASSLLLAVTNHVTQNIASVPLLWLVPLTLYLLTFIIAFTPGLYRSSMTWYLVLVALAGMAWVLVDPMFQFSLTVQLGVFLAGLFLGCLFCHGELYERRPEPARLTTFYLSVAAGGALGGLFVAVAAPLLFVSYTELGISLVALSMLTVIRSFRMRRHFTVVGLAVLLAIVGSAMFDFLQGQWDVRVSSRNFYGTIRVKQFGASSGDGHVRQLFHGMIVHGEQYLAPDRRAIPTTYYRPTSGAGAAIASRGDTPIRVGLIGLGVGTLATYGRPGDVYRFYELDPQVVDVARNEFTFLSDSKASIEISIGDGRVSLEREAPNGFDVLVVDAFSGDGIPVHLVTLEALEVFFDHTKVDGIIAFHVTNRFVDLVPVVGRLAQETGAFARVITEQGEGERPRSVWVVVSRTDAAIDGPAFASVGAELPQDRPEWRTWTDDYSNLVQILR